MAQQAIGGQGLLNFESSQSHSDISHSVGLLRTSDQPDAETWLYLATHNTCPREIPSKWEAAHPHLRRRGQWNHQHARTHTHTRTHTHKHTHKHTHTHTQAHTHKCILYILILQLQTMWCKYLYFWKMRDRLTCNAICQTLTIPTFAAGAKQTINQVLYLMWYILRGAVL